MNDLEVFLETGQSPKYDSEKILGRWKFDITSAINAFRRMKPNTTSKELLAVRRYITSAFENTSFVAMTDGKAILKNSPPLRLTPAASATPQTYEGGWKNLDGKYQLTLTLGGSPQDLAATVEGDRLTLANEGIGFVFNRED
jgi:hypothetical protein